jgi:general stress protein 26
MQSIQSNREALWGMIKFYRFAMFTTRERGDVLRSRPMTTIQQDFDGTLWFFAAAESDVVRAIERYAQVSVSYGNSNDVDFVCVAGPAAIVGDAQCKEALWNPMVQAWFPQGPDADSVVLIKVRADRAEYWDSTHNKLVQLLSMVKAVANGSQPRAMGEHRKVSMQ